MRLAHALGQLFIHQRQADGVLRRVESLIEFVQLPKNLQGPGEMNHGGSRVACFHPSHCVSRRTNPLRKIFLCQVSASTRKRNRLTESGQAARDGQWWYG